MALSGPTPAPSWEEDECLDYYGMLSLHRMFEVVGGQLTECELELLAFLLDEVPGAAGGLARARSGLELLMELERRGQCDESNLRLLGQLLRVLARHDLLPHLARKRRRPDIRLRVRAEYCEHGPALEQGVASRRPQALARQLDVFGQATAVLRSRDLGSVVCDIKFSELSYLDAFWGDYLSGALLQALRGVFLTEALREAVGREAVRLLVSVDEADYEAGRRRLLLMEEEGGRRPTEAS
ncbi:DNA-binding death effector domain-containing protein 2 [Camelus dromedarius]|uniref:DNA-binding death effector domain-containing protein 2 n=1 Tax=Camelus dromedarius TaxID=9838 RepID=A0A5N4DVB9_CAMDR|nr:DNA-binding death effector domain-containing protein 2 [Camelus dromedarius]